MPRFDRKNVHTTQKGHQLPAISVQTHELLPRHIAVSRTKGMKLQNCQFLHIRSMNIQLFLLSLHPQTRMSLHKRPIINKII